MGALRATTLVNALITAKATINVRDVAQRTEVGTGTSSIVNGFYTTTGEHGQQLTIYQMISFVFLFLILFLGWILNCTVIIGLRRDQRLSHITYFYVISLCVAMLLLAALDFPPAVIYDAFGNKPLMDIICIAWIYMDTFLCNVIFLHVFGASLDSYLRLRNPCRYVHSTRRGSTWLKLAAPWGVSFIQTTTQFAITRRYTGLFKESVCLMEDPNFLILRTAMSYALPMFAAVILIFLAVKQLRDQRFLSQEALADLVKSYHGSAAFDEQTQCLWDDAPADYDDYQGNENYDDDGTDRHSCYGEETHSNSGTMNRRIPGSSSCGQISTITRDLTTETFVAPSSSADHLRMPPIPELVEHFCPKHGRLTYHHGTGSGGEGTPVHPPIKEVNGNEDANNLNEYSPNSSNYKLGNYPMQVMQTSLLTTDTTQVTVPSTSSTVQLPSAHIYYAHSHCTCANQRVFQAESAYNMSPSNSSTVDNGLRVIGRTESLNRFSPVASKGYSTINGGSGNHNSHPSPNLVSSQTVMSDLGTSTLPRQRNHRSPSYTNTCYGPHHHNVSRDRLMESNLESGSVDRGQIPEEHVVTTISQLCSEQSSSAQRAKYLSHMQGSTRENGRNHIRISWCRVYKTEKTAIALNMVSCIVSVGLWSPFMLATLLHGLCKQPLCTLEVPTKRLAEFKWLAYSSVLAYALLFLIVDKRIRQAAILAVLCKKGSQ